jgi:hypothetical protein
MHESLKSLLAAETMSLNAEDELPAVVVNDMSLGDLLPVAAKVFMRQLELEHHELSLMLDLLRLKGEEELAAGEGVCHGCVEVEKRRNGFVRVKFTQ